MSAIPSFRYLDNALWYQSGAAKFFWSMMPWEPPPDWPPPFPNIPCGFCRTLLPADLYAAAWVDPSPDTLMRVFEHLRTLLRILYDYVPRQVSDLRVEGRRRAIDPVAAEVGVDAVQVPVPVFR